MDPNNEKSYTIGCAKAVDIEEDSWQLNYIRIDKGDTDIDNAKITAQIGKRKPSSCYSTWCAFSEETHTIAGDWSIDIPGSGYYFPE